MQPIEQESYDLEKIIAFICGEDYDDLKSTNKIYILFIKIWILFVLLRSSSEDKIDIVVEHLDLQKGQQFQDQI